MVNLDSISQNAESAMTQKPEIELVSNTLSGVVTGYKVRITFFKDTPEEFKEEYDVSSALEDILYRMQLLEAEALYVGRGESVQKLYISMKPSIKKWGRFLNELGGVWLLYGCLQIIWSINKNYYELVDECWKKIGLWK